MRDLELHETIEALRVEIATAAQNAARADIKFPITAIDVEFQVAVTREGGANAGIKFWVIEAGAHGELTSATQQRVKLSLGPPVDAHGCPILVGRPAIEPPL